MKLRLLLLIGVAMVPLLALWYRARHAPAPAFSSVPPTIAAAPILPNSQIRATPALPSATSAPVRKLRLTVIPLSPGKPIPERLLSQAEVDKDHWPNTEIQLFYSKKMPDISTNGPEVLTIHHAWYKPIPSAAWREVSRAIIEACHFSVMFSGRENGQKNGNVEALAFDDPPAGMWRLEGEIVVPLQNASMSVPTKDWGIPYEGHAHFKVLISTPQSEHWVNPVGTRPTWIARLEWAPTLKGPWKTVPQPGEEGFPLHVQQPLDLYLRAVRKFPNEPWPSSDLDRSLFGATLPRWAGVYWDSHFSFDDISLPRDVVHLNRTAMFWPNFDRVEKGKGVVASADQKSLLTISVNAGDTMTASLWVEPLGGIVGG